MSGATGGVDERAEHIRSHRSSVPLVPILPHSAAFIRFAWKETIQVPKLCPRHLTRPYLSLFFMTFESMGREAPLVEIRSIECFIDINDTSPAFPPDRVPTTSLAYQSTHGVLLLRVVSCPISHSLSLSSGRKA